MSDFLKKFKSVFIVEDPAKAGATPEKAAAAEAVVTPVVQHEAPPPSFIPAGNVNEKFVELLMTALEQNNQTGFDYFEFRQALLNLAKMPMDEQTRFQSAYAMAQTMGTTPAKLVESANFYLQVLGGEQSKFNEAHAQQRARLIGNREEEIKNLEAAIQQKTNQIAELTQQIEAHRSQSEQVRAEIDSSTVKIETTKGDFEKTFSHVVGQLQSDVEKIKKYLGA